MNLVSNGSTLQWNQDSGFHSSFKLMKEELTFIVRGIPKKDWKNVKAKYLQLWAEQNGRKLLNSLNPSDEDLKSTYCILKQLEENCKPRYNEMAAATSILNRVPQIYWFS